MSNPTPGKTYTTVSGDTFPAIASRAYGDSGKWPLIWRANQTKIKTQNPETVFPGEVLIIPIDTEKPALEPMAFGKKPDDLTILINGYEISFESARVIRTMDTAADGWTASIEWNKGKDKRLDKLTLPYAYPDAVVYIGSERIVSGRLYTVANESVSNGIQKKLEGWSYTADVIDSTMKPPYEFNGTNLKQIANQLVKPLGIDVVFEADPGAAFERATATSGQTIFSFLLSLAVQRSLLISSSPSGDLVFLRASANKPIGTIREPQANYLAFSARFNGRERFNSYKAILQSPWGDSETAVSKDNLVPLSRFMNFTVDDSKSGELQQIADWKRSKQIADSLTMPFPVVGWFGPDKKIWRENTLVTVISDTLCTPDGFDFLIRSVEYNFDKNNQTAILNLIPPQVFTGESIPDLWR